MAYELKTSEELAHELEQRLCMPYQSALRAVESEDRDLGRSWAIKLLEGDSEYERRQSDITRHREGLRRAVAAGR
jgi:hypothetical protein